MTNSQSTCTVIEPGQGRSYWLVGDHITFKVGPEPTRGAFSIAEVFIAPGGGPPPHVHRREDEMFYILDGDFAFILGDQTLRGSKGSAVYLPKGVPHAFKNVGQTPGRFLVTAAPCGFESFVPEAGTPCACDDTACPPVTQADIDRLLAACPTYGVEMLFEHKAQAPAPPRGPDREWRALGQHITMKLGSEETAGNFSLVEITSPVGSEVPRHLHREQDEVFRVLEGTYEFMLSDGPGGAVRTITALPGSFVHVPKGTYHGFRNAGEKPARLVNYHAPGGFEKFFEEADAVSPTPPTNEADAAKVVALCRKHGMELR